MQVTMMSRVVRKENCFAAPMGDEQVLLDVDTSNFIRFNPVASAIWDRLATPIGVDALCDGLRAEYAGDDSVIGAEVLAFLSDMIEQGLVRTA